MAEVATVDMFGGLVELGHCCSHGAGHTRADEQGDQFNDGEENSYAQQDVFDALNVLSQRLEKMRVEHRRTGPHSYRRSWFLPPGFPIDRRKRSARERDLKIHAARWSGQIAHPENGSKKPLAPLHCGALFARIDCDAALAVWRIDGKGSVRTRVRRAGRSLAARAIRLRRCAWGQQGNLPEIGCDPPHQLQIERLTGNHREIRRTHFKGTDNPQVQCAAVTDHVTKLYP